MTRKFFFISLTYLVVLFATLNASNCSVFLSRLFQGTYETNYEPFCPLIIPSLCTNCNTSIDFDLTFSNSTSYNCTNLFSPSFIVYFPFSFDSDLNNVTLNITNINWAMDNDTLQIYISPEYHKYPPGYIGPNIFANTPNVTLSAQNKTFSNIYDFTSFNQTSSNGYSNAQYYVYFNITASQGVNANIIFTYTNDVDIFNNIGYILQIVVSTSIGIILFVFVCCCCICCCFCCCFCRWRSSKNNQPLDQFYEDPLILNNQSDNNYDNISSNNDDIT
jgi:hypothetical protein